MNKLGKHHNLPSILQQPSLSSYSSTNNRRETPMDELTPAARNQALRSHQQAVSLFTEVNRDNLQIVRTKPEDSAKCGTPEKQAKSNATATQTRGVKDSNVIQEECKENSLPPMTAASLDYKLCTPLPEKTSCDGRGFTPVMINAGGSFPVPSSDSANASPVILPVQPVHINIHSVPIYKIVQPQLNVNINRTVASTHSTETITVHQDLSKLQWCRAEIPHGSQISTEEPCSDAQSKDLQEDPSSETISSTPQSPPQASLRKTCPKKAFPRTGQYQCPKCLLRFDRILAQLQHKCYPQRTQGGSLRNWPSLKLYKCLECREEFSDLEGKIRHTCSARKEAESPKTGYETVDASPSATGVQAEKNGGINWHHTPQGTVVCNMCSYEVTAKKKQYMKLHMAKHVGNKKKRKAKGKKRKAVSTETKSAGPTYYKQFKCGLCGMKYRLIGYLKKHIASHIGTDEYKQSNLPYVCRLCKTHFKTSKALKIHNTSMCDMEKKIAGIKQKIIGLSDLTNSSASSNDSAKEVNLTVSKIATGIPEDTTPSSPAPQIPSNRHSLQQPGQTPSQKQLNKCGFCGITCDTDTALLKHARTHWNEIFEKPSNPMICSRCNEEFDNCVKLFLHVKRNSCMSASDDTSQSDSEEVVTPATVDRPEDSSSDDRPEVKACRKRKTGNIHCPHCSITFWRPQLLAIHLQSSHPLLLDKEEMPLKDADVSSDTNQAVNPSAVNPRESSDPVLPTLPHATKTDDGKTNLPPDPTSSCRDSADTEKETVGSRRTETYPCQCNACELDFPKWRHLDKHRRACHPRKVRHLKLGVNQQGSPDESPDELSVEIIRNDFFHPCDLCDKVFRQWRSLALHMKAKHQVRCMFARYSSAEKQLKHKSVALPKSDFVICQSGKTPSTRNPSLMEQASKLDTQDPEYSNMKITHGLEKEEGTRHSCSPKRPLEQHQHLFPSSSDRSSQHPLTVFSLETQTENPVSCDNQKVQYQSISDEVELSLGESTSQKSTLTSLPEPKRTVEDLRISSVVSLYEADLHRDNSPWQRNKSVREVNGICQPSVEKNNWQQNLQELSTDVTNSLPAPTQCVSECHQSTPQDEMLFQPLPTAKVQQDTQEAFDCLIDTVLAMESSDQTNNFRSKSAAGHVSSGHTNAPSHEQQGLHGTMKKIPFFEAKNILKAIEKNPSSNSYHCRICGEWFEHIPRYTSHILAHCGSELYHCSFCGLKSHNIFAILHHVIETHTLPNEPNGPVADRAQSPFKAVQASSPPVNSDGRGQLHSNEAPPLDSVCSLVHHADPGTMYPRPLYDYIFNPSDVEINLNSNAKSGSYECPLCPLKIKEKDGLVYHLRMHHNQQPYKCTHCHQRSSFILDVQVHFFEHHYHMIQAGQQQAGKALKNQDSLPDSQFLHQFGDEHFNVLSETTSSGEVTPMSFRNCSSEPSGIVTANLSDRPCGVYTTLEQQYRSSNSDLPGQVVTIQEHGNGEDSCSSFRVKQESLADDEPCSQGCLLKEVAISNVQTKSESGITVKTEILDVCHHHGAKWVEQTDCDNCSFQNQTTASSGERQPHRDAHPSDIPVIYGRSELPGETSPCSTRSESIIHKLLDEDNCFKESEESEPSDLMRAEKELDFCHLKSPRARASDSAATVDCGENSVNHEDGERSLLKDVGISVAIKEVVEKSTRPVVATQLNKVNTQKTDTQNLVDRATLEMPGLNGTDSGKASVSDVQVTSTTSAVGSQTTSESPGIGGSTAAEDSIPPEQPLDDLYQLASDMGIIVSGSNMQECPVGNVSCTLENSSMEGDESSNIYSVTDQDDVHIQATEMASSDNMSTCTSVSHLTSSGDDSKLPQEDASSIGTNEIRVGRDKNTETTALHREELDSPTSPCLLRKRPCEDGQETFKRKKLATSPLVEKVNIQNKDIPSIRIKLERESPFSGGCRESNSSKAPCMEASKNPILHQAEEAQMADDLPNDINLGENEIVSEILKEMAKNCFTSKIIECLEKESATVSSQNSLDLDLTGPPCFSGSKRTTETAEQPDSLLIKERQNDTRVNSKQVTEDDNSGMPKIFDVAGNGQMPELPGGYESDSWNNIPPISPCQDRQADVAAVTEASSEKGNGTTNGSAAEGPDYPVRSSDYSSTSEPRCPVIDSCFATCDGISSSSGSFKKSGGNPQLRALLETNLREHNQPPDEPSSRRPAFEGPLGPHGKDAQSINVSPSVRLGNEHEFQECPRTWQRRRQSFHGDISYSCEDSWMSYYQTPDLLSPPSRYKDPSLIHQHAASPEHQFQYIPYDKRSLTVQDDDVHKSQLKSPQTASLPLNHKEADSYPRQQHYQDSLQGSNNWSEQSPMHSHQERSTQKFFSTNRPMAMLSRMSEAITAYSHSSVHSTGQCWAYGEHQEKRSPNVGNPFHLQKRSREPSYKQWHHSRGFQENLDDPTSMTRYSMDDSLAYPFKSPEADVQRVTARNWSTEQVQQNRVPNVHRSSWNPLAESRWPQLKQQSAPSSSSPPNPGSLYRYHSMGRPIGSQTREEAETMQKETHQTASPPIQRGPAYGSQAWYPTSHSEENTSVPLPQIVSVMSLHPRYLQRTHTM